MAEKKLQSCFSQLSLGGTSPLPQPCAAAWLAAPEPSSLLILTAAADGATGHPAADPSWVGCCCGIPPRPTPLTPPSTAAAVRCTPMMLHTRAIGCPCAAASPSAAFPSCEKGLLAFPLPALIFGSPAHIPAGCTAPTPASHPHTSLQQPPHNPHAPHPPSPEPYFLSGERQRQYQE